MRAFSALFVLLVLAALPARATVMVPVPLEVLVEEAIGIVHARVVESRVQMVVHPSGDSLDPYTVTTLEVREWIKGGGPQRITLREYGGEHRLGGARIDGTPVYALHEELIVFLAPSESPRHYRTLHMAQGKLVVLPGVPGAPALVARDLRGVALADRAAFGLTSVRHGARETMPLSELRALIGQALRTPASGDVLGGAR